MAKIHSLETFGAVDGPGIRFVIFMQGCPMRCLYCHNPDTWSFDGGKEMSVEELMTEIRKYKHYFGDDGGVTVSGGEPMAQIDFVIELFKSLKKEGINTCIDSSGIFFNRGEKIFKKIKKLLKYTDLVLLDIKHIERESHKKLTGHYNDNILDFARFLSEKSIPVWIRYVLVPTINEDKESLIRLKAFLDGLKNVEKIEVLPYHTMGVVKYKELGMNYPLEGVSVPTKEQITLASNILKGDMKC